jgi:hypothetical protein
MCAKWNEKYNPELIAKHLENCKHFDDSGNFTGFNAFESHDYFTVLESCVNFHPEIPENEKGIIINKAVFPLAKQKPALNAQNILSAIGKEEIKYLKKPKQDFFVATTISINFFEELKKTVVNGSSIKFYKTLPKKFNQKPIYFLKERLRIVDNPSTYTPALVSIKARDEGDAFVRAIDELDLLRGIWNLAANREMRLFGFPSHRTKPINKITLGSFHTIHLPKGDLATTETIWYEPDFTENQFDIKKKWQSVKSFEKYVKKQFSKHPYKVEIEDLIRRYVRALDRFDLHVAFIELWGVLERLTGTATVKTDYDKTTKRAAFLYEDADLHRQVLQHLRIYRNANVHAGQRSERIETFLFQLKRYVDNLFFVHIRNRFKFESLDKAATFFDLPTQTSELDNRINMLKNVKKFRTP